MNWVRVPLAWRLISKSSFTAILPILATRSHAEAIAQHGHAGADHVAIVRQLHDHFCGVFAKTADRL